MADKIEVQPGSSTRNRTGLRERNLKVTKNLLMNSEENKKLRESFKKISAKHLGCEIDPYVDTEKFPVTEDGFSWRKVATKLEEADASSSFPQVLRAGVQTIVNQSYQMVETTYEDWVKVISSTKNTELYAPLHGIGFPRQVGPQEVYPEVAAAGLNIKLPNYKFGTMFAVEDELLMDDQTGQFQQQAGLLGEYMKLLVEAYVYGKLASVANARYSVLSIPTSETKPSDEASAYPWIPASTGFQGGGYNRPASYAALDQTTLQNAKIGLMNQVNLLGLKMNVDGNRLLIGATNQFTAATLLNSSYYPTGATAGAVGGAFSINPIKGLADVSCSRFMFKNDGTCDGTSKAWYLVDDTKPWFICQMREPAYLEQEAPNAGASFERDVTRFKVRMRMNADFIDPRFAWQGNDGSV